MLLHQGRVRAYIGRYVRNPDIVDDLAQEVFTRLLRVQRSLVQKYGREPSNEELALESGILTPEDVEAVAKSKKEGAAPLDRDVQRRQLRCQHLR